jgi:integrase/recombinase XerC
MDSAIPVRLSDAVRSFERHLRVEKNASPHTLRNYLRDLHDFQEYLRETDRPDPNLADIDRTCMRGYLAHLHKRGNQASTVSRKLSAIRGCFRLARREGFSGTDPVATLPMPKKQSRVPRTLTVDDAFRVLDSSGHQRSSSPALGVRDQAMWEVLYSTGIRVSELAGADLKSLSLSEGTLRVHGKGSKERIVPLGSKATAALSEYLKVRASLQPRESGSGAPLFVNARGTRISDRGIRTLLTKRLREIGMAGKASPHTLRHSMATHLLEAGANLRDIQELLGHQKYTHLAIDRLFEVYDQAHPRALSERGSRRKPASPPKGGGE